MQPRQTSLILLIGIFIFLLLSTIFPQTIVRASLLRSKAWQYSDLRMLHVNPTNFDGFAAGYIRRSDGQLQIRLDRLGSQPSSPYDVYIALSTHPYATTPLPLQASQSTSWDRILVLPASGNPFCEGPEGRYINQLCFQFQADPTTGDMVFSVKESSLPGNIHNLQVQAFLVGPQSMDFVDTIGPFSWNAPPPARAPLLLEFWDSMPGVTPAQALRRWDGAHTGPYGDRHGLSKLLSAASQAGIPITLLDLKTPQSLSSLDAVGGISVVQEMVARGLLLLPDVVYGDPLTAQTSLQNSRTAGAAYSFPSSPVVYGDIPFSLLSDQSNMFAELPDPHHIGTRNHQRLLPLPELSGAALDPQVAETGLTLESQKALLTIARTADPTDLVVLGGSLPSSAWGDSRMAAPAMAYVANHPWIWPLTERDLAAFPSGAAGNQPACGYTLCSVSSPADSEEKFRSQLRASLAAAPANPISSLAWDAYLNLTAPTADSTLQALRNGYLGIVKELLAAAAWVDNPVPENRCPGDFDGDGIPDCVLASSQQYLMISTAGARVLLGISRRGASFVQWTGSLAQFAVGMSDSSAWQPDLGPSGDPGDIPGAFSDVDSTWEKYTFVLKPGTATFTSSNGDRQKRFELLQNGIRVTYSGFQAVETTMPLVVDPQIRYIPGWQQSYSFVNQRGNISWRVSGKWQVQVITTATTSFSNSLESLSFLNKPENPDQGFSEGHFLPFPTALIKIKSENKHNFEILVTVSTP